MTALLFSCAKEESVSPVATNEVQSKEKVATDKGTCCVPQGGVIWEDERPKAFDDNMGMIEQHMNLTSSANELLEVRNLDGSGIHRYQMIEEGELTYPNLSVSDIIAAGNGEALHNEMRIWMNDNPNSIMLMRHYENGSFAAIAK